VRNDRRKYIGGRPEQREDGRTSTGDGLRRDSLSSFSTSSSNVDGSCVSVGPEWRRRRLPGAVVDARLTSNRLVYPAQFVDEELAEGKERKGTRTCMAPIVITTS